MNITKRRHDDSRKASLVSLTERLLTVALVSLLLLLLSSSSSPVSITSRPPSTIRLFASAFTFSARIVPRSSHSTTNLFSSSTSSQPVESEPTTEESHDPIEEERQTAQSSTLTPVSPPSSLLSDAIGYNVSAVSVLLEEIQSLRSTAASAATTSTTAKPTVDPVSSYLDGLLDTRKTSDTSKSPPFWTKSKRLARFSNRARYASLQRVLDRFTPPISSSTGTTSNGKSTGDDNGDDDDVDVQQKQQQRRRSLLAVLRSLAELDNKDEEIDTEKPQESEERQRRNKRSSKDPAIVILERKAIEESKQTDRDDLRTRLPEGLETPKYDVIDRLDQKIVLQHQRRRRRWRRNAVSSGAPIEIRTYEPYSVCSVSMNRPRPTNNLKTDAKISMPEMSGASSFGALAGYLFGKNEQSTSMKMTTPVFTKTTAAETTTNTGSDDDDDDEEEEEEQDKQQRQMEFVLPSDYWTSSSLNDAPTPLQGSGVELQNVDSETRAVIMFGGYASPKDVTKRKKELLDALTVNNNYGDSNIDQQQQQKSSSSSSTTTTDDAADFEWTTTEQFPSFTLAQYNDPFTVPWKRLNEVSVRVVRTGRKKTEE